MTIAQQTAEVLATESQAQPQYQFVIDTDLVHVGGGSTAVDY